VASLTSIWRRESDCERFSGEEICTIIDTIIILIRGYSRYFILSITDIITSYNGWDNFRKVSSVLENKSHG